jgi:hypothetical protein
MTSIVYGVLAVFTALSATLAFGVKAPEQSTDTATPNVAPAETYVVVLPEIVEELPIPDTARCPQWWALAREVGWPEEWMPTFDRIMYKESRCRINSWNKDDAWRGSMGLMQVNTGWRRWLDERDVLVKDAELFDPETNLKAALLIWEYSEKKNGWGWAQWYIPKTANWCEFPEELRHHKKPCK